jgi:hypothetical protein
MVLKVNPRVYATVFFGYISGSFIDGVQIMEQGFFVAFIIQWLCFGKSHDAIHIIGQFVMKLFRNSGLGVVAFLENFFFTFLFQIIQPEKDKATIHVARSRVKKRG